MMIVVQYVWERLMLTIVRHDTYIKSDSLNIVNCYWIWFARKIAAIYKH